MPHAIFDTHSHYTDDAFAPDREEVLRTLPEHGVVHAVLAGTTMEDSAAGIALAHAHEILYAAVGIHPETAGSQPADYLAQLEKLAAQPKVVAIGEIGLDYHYAGYDREQQIILLREQLDLAKQLDLPVIIHARMPQRITYAFWRNFVPAVWCTAFPAAQRRRSRCWKLGMYIGFTGILTFSNAKRHGVRWRRCRKTGWCWKRTAPTWRRCPCAAGGATVR